MHYQTKLVDIIYNGFRVVPKTASANLCKVIHHINDPTLICPFESGKCEKELKNLQKFEYLESKKNFLDEIKKHFLYFLEDYSVKK